MPRVPLCIHSVRSVVKSFSMFRMRLHECMRPTVLLFIVLCEACATAGGFHGQGAPVSWSISKTDSPKGRTTLVCGAEDPRPCVLERSATGRVKYATFTLHVWGPSPTKFTGSMLISFLDDRDPRRYKSEVELISTGKEVHHNVFSRITTVPARYSVRVQLEETRADLQQPRSHDLEIPVIVQ